MKKLFMIAAMMVATLSANAQNALGEWSIKPMAGVNLATLTKTNDSKMRVGLAAGAEFAVGAAENFEISFGALYSMQGCKFKEEGYKETFKYDYINIPVLANYYVAPGFAIKAGVQPGFNVSKKWKAEVLGVTSEGTDDDVKGFYLSVPVGLSYEFSSFVIDARYNWGLTKVWKDDDAKHSFFTITLGYKLPL